MGLAESEPQPETRLGGAQHWPTRAMRAGALRRSSSGKEGWAGVLIGQKEFGQVRTSASDRTNHICSVSAAERDSREFLSARETVGGENPRPTTWGLQQCCKRSTGWDFSRPKALRAVTTGHPNRAGAEEAFGGVRVAFGLCQRGFSQCQS